MGPFEHDRYLVDQLVRPDGQPLPDHAAGGGRAAGGPACRLRAAEADGGQGEHPVLRRRGETQEVFHIQGRSWLDTGGSRYDVNDAQDGHIGILSHIFGKSLVRSTWRLATPDEEEIAIAHERSQTVGILRRAIDFVPDIGGLIPIPYNFDILVGGEVIGHLNRKFNLRDQYVLDLTGDPERKLDRRLAIALAVGLDTLQNR